MKTKFILIAIQLFLFLFIRVSTNAQNPCEKHISTNYLAPFNPYSFPDNRYNPWINSDFYIGKLDLGNPAKIKLNGQLNWSNDFLSTANTTILNMYNPYTSDGTPGSRYDYLHRIGVDFEFRDYKWEDGWELLWIGTGYYPNGEPVNVQNSNRAFAQAENNPGNGRVPYVILYNRYRGVMRVFMNLVTDFSSYSNIKTIIDIQGTGNLSGLLRHLEPLDRALDQTTNIDRIESFNPKPGDWNQWYSIDYTLGYDPCICGKNLEINILSQGISEAHLEMYGRGISAEVPIIQNGQPNYDLDWLTQHDVNAGLEGGNRIFTTLDAMIEDYKDAMTQYQINNEVFQDYTERKAVLDALKGFIVDGTVGLIPGGGTFKTWFIKAKVEGSSNFGNFIKGSGKGLLGYGYDQLSMGINPKTSQPKPPDMPTATYSEIRFTGNIEGSSQAATIGPFFVPGSYDEQSSLTNLSSPYRYPAYNVAPGLVAMLETPQPLFNYSSESSIYYTLVYGDGWDLEGPGETIINHVQNNTVLNLRFDEEPKFLLNTSLDFDNERTATYVMIEVELKNEMPEELEQTNYYNDNSFELGNSFILDYTKRESDGKLYNFKSNWVMLEDLNQQQYKLPLRSSCEITTRQYSSAPPFLPYIMEQPNWGLSDLELNVSKIKMKVLHDFYFDQIGSNGEQVNTTQVFTYLLYDAESNVNNLGDEQGWDIVQPGAFDQYIPGLVNIGNETISTASPLVNETIGNAMYIRAENVHIIGNLEVQLGYTLIIEALAEIDASPGAAISPNLHLKIRKDFYDIPVFKYASLPTDFCNIGGGYMADFASRPLIQRNDDEQLENHEVKASLPVEKVDSRISLSPNPANSQIQISSSSKPISEIQIFDLSGRSLIQKKTGNDIQQVEVNIEQLQSGVYIVQTLCEDERSSEKLVVVK